MYEIKVFTDGGARGNPGPAAIGVVLSSPDGEQRLGRCIGESTNNVAEYTAVVDALGLVKECLRVLPVTVDRISFFLDSELVVKQLNGQYRVKDPGLQALYQKVWSYRQELGVPCTFTHIPRCQNKEADRLVNAALDGEPVLTSIPVK
jgi:ribonuclease HI